jgi:hypothetical protein
MLKKDPLVRIHCCPCVIAECVYIYICEDAAMLSALVRDARADCAAWLPKLKKDLLVRHDVRFDRVRYLVRTPECKGAFVSRELVSLILKRDPLGLVCLDI